ncbi:hypothetical protein PM082_017806 [Marasmius tenuissimus]|nr:hypothetical protein PM082_017806 [Marasmius tenuissimus]
MGNNRDNHKRRNLVGTSVRSPVKKYSKKNSRTVVLEGQLKRKNKLKELLAQCLGLQPVASGSQGASDPSNNTSTDASSGLSSNPTTLESLATPSALPDSDIQMEMDDVGHQYPNDDEAISPLPLPFPSGLNVSTSMDNPRTSTRRSSKKPNKTPEERAIQFDAEWQRLLVTLEDSFINYWEQMYGKYLDPSQPVIYCCKTGQCQVLKSSIHAYYYDHTFCPPLVFFTPR